VSSEVPSVRLEIVGLKILQHPGVLGEKRVDLVAGFSRLIDICFLRQLHVLDSGIRSIRRTGWPFSQVRWDRSVGRSDAQPLLAVNLVKCLAVQWIAIRGNNPEPAIAVVAGVLASEAEQRTIPLSGL
jgi:hypothetical protein